MLSAIQKLRLSKLRALAIPLAFLSIVCLHYLLTVSNNIVLTEDEHLHHHPPPRRRIWISTSVCFSGNTNYFKKEHFPYRLAAKLNADLWRQKTNYSTVVQVIYQEDYTKKEEKKEALEAFVEDLKSVATVVKTVQTKEMDCALKSQVQRLFAFEVPEIDDSDIIVMSDADAFVMQAGIFGSYFDNDEDMKVWIFQYDYAVKNEFTFPMSFVAMEKRLWRELMLQEEGGGGRTPEEILEKYRQKHPSETSKVPWDLDQSTVTRLILKNSLCTIPSNSRVWKMLGLDQPQQQPPPPPPPPQQQQSSFPCFRGDERRYSNCNKKVYRKERVPSSCLWWHFHPEDDPTVVRKVHKTFLAWNVTSS